ncbi:MAG TPA: TrkA C-terminal domain-containing protein [Verrucomicrobiae bacterium]
MWEWAGHVLHESAVLRLFIVVGVGYLLGEVKFPGNFRFGLAAVLFAGLGFGALDPKFLLPNEVQTIGLVLFVYCVGLEAAPGFLQSLRKDGLRLNLALAVCLCVAALAVYLIMRFGGVSRETLVGLFCGALTNTPALGAASETIFRMTGNAASVNQAVVGYGVVYPFAVLATLLLFQLRTMRAAPAELEPPPNTLPRAQTVEVQKLNDSREWTAGDIEAAAGVVITRIRQLDGRVTLAKTDTTLERGTHVVIVGSPKSLDRAVELLGAPSRESLEANLAGFETHRYFVSNPKIAGRPLKDLELEKLGAVVSRIRRADVDLPVSDETVLHLGDRVRVISDKTNAEAVRKFFGNSLSALSETGYVSFALGIALGLLIGEIPIPVPGLEGPVRLGHAGGPLLMALILGYLGRTGPFIWNPPVTVSLTLKHIGILFFLACAGVKAGAVLPATFREQGGFLICVGVALTILTHLLFWAILRWPTKYPLGKDLGASAGLQTQPAALTFAAQKLSAAEVNLAYATVYPAAVVLKVLLVQLLLTVP